MGGTVSGIIIASGLSSIGFFYLFFTPFLMRPPWYRRRAVDNCPEKV
jgi:hypothetical protein